MPLGCCIYVSRDRSSDRRRPVLRPPIGLRRDTGRHRSKWLLKVVLEVLFIGIGVFLALMGEQWRERAHTRELTHASLQRFRSEVLTNRKAVAAVKDYHVALLKSLRVYLAADTKTRRSESVEIRGLQPVFFEHTAWDLALATQSLANIDPTVAFGLSRIRSSTHICGTDDGNHAGDIPAPHHRELRGLGGLLW